MRQRFLTLLLLALISTGCVSLQQRAEIRLVEHEVLALLSQIEDLVLFYDPTGPVFVYGERTESGYLIQTGGSLDKDVSAWYHVSHSEDGGLIVQSETEIENETIRYSCLDKRRRGRFLFQFDGEEPERDDFVCPMVISQVRTYLSILSSQDNLTTSYLRRLLEDG